MSVLQFVRHGQASFFSSDYDQLSSLGFEQAAHLAEYWLVNGVVPTEVYAGTLLRQQQTAQAVGDVFVRRGLAWPQPEFLPGLNEYCAERFMVELRAELEQRDPAVKLLSEQFDAATDEQERYRSFHRLLEAVMRHYVAGEYECGGFESWRAFHDRVSQAVDEICGRAGRGRHIAVFTSGGPIGVAVQRVMRAPEQQAAELNWRIYNSSVTRFTFRPGRVTLDQFNTIPHLTEDRLRTYR